MVNPVVGFRVKPWPGQDGGMRIGQVADAAGVTVEALRFYERRGLLPAPARTGSGYRDYPARAVAVVRFIKHAQQLGFALDDVDAMLHLARGGPDDCDAVRDLATAKIADVTDKIRRLEAIRAALTQLVDTCQRPRHDRQCPLLAAELPADA
jgi:DNA-binding transcriptional MerR regulator